MKMFKILLNGCYVDNASSLYEAITKLQAHGYAVIYRAKIEAFVIADVGFDDVVIDLI
jgi:DNA-binding PadR family transcriptional regulator